jgi:hypothetical protein
MKQNDKSEMEFDNKSVENLNDSDTDARGVDVQEALQDETAGLKNEIQELKINIYGMLPSLTISGKETS